METEKPFGLINLDKPVGVSSARVVNQVKRLLPRKTRIGHAGTLDPFATGVLLLLVGRATRWCEGLMDAPKSYEAVIKLGACTATDDPESPELPFRGRSAAALPVTLEQIEGVLPRFVGTILQKPPPYSAMKVGGQRAYKLARQGETVELPARPVRVDRFAVLAFDWPYLRVAVDCGRGTYIRALARDLGEALDIGGYLTELRRTRIGSFHADDAVTLQRLQTHGAESFLQIPAAIENPPTASHERPSP